MTLIHEPSDGSPLCGVQIAFRGGCALDPVGWEGLTRHANELARRGTKNMSRAVLDQRLDELGASIESTADRDQVGLSLLCLRRHLDEVLDLAVSILSEPRLEEVEHEKLVRETEATLSAIRDDDSSLTQRHFARVVHPGHVYARSTVGTDASLAALANGYERVAAHWKTLVARDLLIVGVAGDIAPNEADRLYKRIADVLHGKGPERDDPRTAAPTTRRAQIVDKPDRAQAQVLLGHTTHPYSAPEFPALLLAETAFGGMFSSPLVQDIRVEHGWSYGVGSHIGKGRAPLWLSCDLAPALEDAKDAIPRTVEMFEQFADKGPTADEFSLAQKYLVGSLPFGRATARQRMSNGVHLAVYGLPLSHADGIHEALGKLSHEEVVAAAKRDFCPDALTLVVTTTRAELDDAALRGFDSVDVCAWDSY